jgi:hypothetical protein
MRVPELTTVAWCTACRTYRNAAEIGTRCDCEAGTPLVERRGYICKRCDLRNVFLSRKAFDRDQQIHDDIEESLPW